MAGGMADGCWETSALPRAFTGSGRRFVLGTEEKEKFRSLMRMQENFTACRALSYCLMDNHFRLLDSRAIARRLFHRHDAKSAKGVWTRRIDGDFSLRMREEITG